MREGLPTYYCQVGTEVSAAPLASVDCKQGNASYYVRIVFQHPQAFMIPPCLGGVRKVPLLLPKWSTLTSYDKITWGALIPIE
jgi:hypothetical protein